MQNIFLLLFRIFKQRKAIRGYFGSFSDNPIICNIALSPLNTVPKKDTVERRIILDLSFPKGMAINDSVSKDFYVADSYSGVDDLVNLIKIKWKGLSALQKGFEKILQTNRN